MQPDPDDDRDQTFSMQKACMVSVEIERSVSLGFTLFFILIPLNSFWHQSKMQSKRCTIFKTFFTAVFRCTHICAYFPPNILTGYSVCIVKFCQSADTEIIYLTHIAY